MITAEGEIPLTVSGGCAVGPLDTPDDQVSRADTALYQAKAAGRDRIVAAAEAPRPAP